MLFDLCYLGVLCAVILFVFVQVLLPMPALETSVSMYSTQMLPHLSLDSLPPQLTILFCVLALLYLKMIWRLIHPPRQ